jgi:hypothetical protein
MGGGQAIRKTVLIGRALARMGANSNTARAGLSAARIAGKAAARSAHVLWLEVTGFFFASFSVIGAGATWREYTHHAGNAKILAAAAFSLLFGYFGVTSFAKARRRNREQ